MFRGTSFQKIDANRRIYIPARFLETIKSSEEYALVMTIEKRNIICFTVEGWERFKAKMLAIKDEPEIEFFKNVLMDHSQKCFIRKRDRVTIPLSLKNSIKIKRDIVIAGALSHFEIWSKESWNAEADKLNADLESVEVRKEAARIGISSD